jgi:endonuclease/exonuclease/phosphatase family metal-dependent hydrolase
MRQAVWILAAAVAGVAALRAPQQPPATGTAGRYESPAGVKVMTFNIQHGIDGSQRYHLQTAIDTIAKINPDIVGLVELTRNHPAYNCDDQPKLIADGVSQATGRRWTWVYHQQWFTKNKECMDSGRGDAAETEGLGFLAPEPLAPPTFIELWNSGLGVAARTSRLPNVPIAITHLAPQVVNAPSRVKQIAKLLPWLDRFGTPRILLGDFNASPGDPEMRPVLGGYHDAWSDAVAAGTARGRQDGVTHKASRIDYILYVPGPRLELLWVDTVDTVPLVGKEASDHRPLVAGFRIGGAPPRQ